jgi:hypothetical protein
MKWKILFFGKASNDAVVKAPSEGDNPDSFRSFRDTALPEKMEILTNLHSD